MSRYPTRFQQKTLWNAATGVSILVLGALLVGLIWLLGQVFGFLQPVLIPLIVAGIIAYLLDPVVRWIERRGLKRVWAVVAVYLILLTGVALLGASLMPGIKRGSKTIQEVTRTVSRAVNPQAVPPPATPEGETAPAVSGEKPAEDSQLTTQLAQAIDKLRRDHVGDPIGWALTETTDGGESILYPKDMPPQKSLEFFWRTRAGRMLSEYQGAILKTGTNWATTGASKILGILGLVLGMIMVPVYLFFFLKDSAAIRQHWHDYVPLKASRFKTELVDCLHEINGYLISFFRGQVLVALIDGFLVGIALACYQLPYGLLIGVFMAILGVIPYIGNILCLIPACIIGYLHAQGSPDSAFHLAPMTYAVGVVAIFVGVQQINSLVTAPKIVGDSVGLHPLTVIFSMLFWSLVLGGFVGALLAVPLTASVKVLFRRYIWQRRILEATDEPEEPEPA